MEGEIVVVKVSSYEDRDYCIHEKLTVNGKDIFRVHPLCECPEDAIIGRDLVSCSEIASFLEKFLRENKGKKVKFEYEKINEEEF